MSNYLLWCFASHLASVWPSGLFLADVGPLLQVVDSIGGDNRTLQVPRFASLALRQGLVQEEEEHSIVDVGWPSVWFGGTISEECQEPGGLDGDDEGCFAAAVYSEVLGEIVTAAMGNLLRVAANLPLAIPVSLASGLLQVRP